MDRTLLAEYGGHVTLTVSWAKSLLKRMHFTKLRGTTKSGLSPEAFQEVKRSSTKCGCTDGKYSHGTNLQLGPDWYPQYNWTMENKVQNV